MVLVHELGEIYIGDVTPQDHIPKKTKYEWEYKAIVELFSKIPSGKQYISFWKEYEEGKTPEAKLIRQIDYLEMGLQAYIYYMQYNIPIDDFIRSTKKRLQDKKLINLFKEVERLTNKTSQK